MVNSITGMTILRVVSKKPCESAFIISKNGPTLASVMFCLFSSFLDDLNH